MVLHDKTVSIIQTFGGPLKLPARKTIIVCERKLVISIMCTCRVPADNLAHPRFTHIGILFKTGFRVRSTTFWTLFYSGPYGNSNQGWLRKGYCIMIRIYLLQSSAFKLQQNLMILLQPNRINLAFEFPFKLSSNLFWIFFFVIFWLFSFLVEGKDC